MQKVKGANPSSIAQRSTKENANTVASKATKQSTAMGSKLMKREQERMVARHHKQTSIAINAKTVGILWQTALKRIYKKFTAIL